jgi:hypothetical protein
MINDGYNRCLTLKDENESFSVIYRPATESERIQFLDITKRMSDATVERMAINFMAAHIVESDLASKYGSLSMLLQFRADMFHSIWKAVNGWSINSNGVSWASQEKDHEQNLREGALLEVTNPRLARRSCDDCKQYWYSEITGLPILTGDGEKMERAGPTLCETMNGCKKGTPEKQKSLNPMNRMAFRHYRECEASTFPNDPIVRKNALIIKSALQSKAKK